MSGERGEENETALSMSAIAGRGCWWLCGGYTATSGRSEWLTLQMEAIASARTRVTTTE